MDRSSRAFANVGIGFGFVVAAIVIAIVDDDGGSLVIGFGAVGAAVLLYGLFRLFTSARG